MEWERWRTFLVRYHLLDDDADTGDSDKSVDQTLQKRVGNTFEHPKSQHRPYTDTQPAGQDQRSVFESQYAVSCTDDDGTHIGEEEIGLDGREVPFLLQLSSKQIYGYLGAADSKETVSRSCEKPDDRPRCHRWLDSDAFTVSYREDADDDQRRTQDDLQAPLWKTQGSDGHCSSHHERNHEHGKHRSPIDMPEVFEGEECGARQRNGLAEGNSSRKWYQSRKEDHGEHREPESYVRLEKCTGEGYEEES